MAEKVISLANRREDARLWSPIQCLEEVLADLKSGKTPCTKVVVCCLDDSDGNYTLRVSQSQMKASEVVALAAVLQTRGLSWMGYIPE